MIRNFVHPKNGQYGYTHTPFNRETIHKDKYSSRAGEAKVSTESVEEFIARGGKVKEIPNKLDSFRGTTNPCGIGSSGIFSNIVS